MKNNASRLAITLALLTIGLLLAHQSLKLLTNLNSEQPHVLLDIRHQTPPASSMPKPSPTTSTTSTTTGAPTTTTTTTEPVKGPCAEWYTEFINAGWDKAEWDTARWIIYRESRCLEGAFNGVDAGLLQINEFHRPLIESLGLVFPDDLFHGETNLWIANVLWWDYGWEPWIYKGVVPGEN